VSPTTTRRFRGAFAAQLGVVTAIVVAAYLGRLPGWVGRIPHFDLAAHAILFGLLGALLDGALGHRPLGPGRATRVGLGPVLVLAAAAAEEVAQLLSPRRSASLADFAADVVGVALLTWLARWWTRRGAGSPPPTVRE
jgi:hypothetical protein